MAKKNNVQNTEPVEEKVEKPQEEQTDPRYVTDEKLQSYYAEAYINERERLNAMFGRLDTYPTATTKEKIVYRDPDLSEYVHVNEYKKLKKKKNIAAAFAIIGWVAAVVLAVVLAIKFIG